MIVQPMLYRHLAFVLRNGWHSTMFLERLLRTGTEWLKCVKEISLSLPAGRIQRGMPSNVPDEDEEIGLFWDSDVEGEDRMDKFGQRKFQAMLLNPLLRMMIDQTQRDTLYSFR